MVHYALEHGLADLSLRPLAAAVGSSPRVLMFLYGNKDGLVRALLARARVDELALLDNVGQSSDGASTGLVAAVERVWAWLAEQEHRPLLRLRAEAYVRSLVEPDGAWAGFARATVSEACIQRPKRVSTHSPPRDHWSRGGEAALRRSAARRLHPPRPGSVGCSDGAR